MKYPFPDPLQNPGQLLLMQQVQQAKTILDLTEANRTLAAAVAAGGCGCGPSRGADELRLRDLTIEQYARQEYLPSRNHPPQSATAEAVEDALKKIKLCFNRTVFVKEITDGFLQRFRTWLCSLVVAGGLAAATANKLLRHFRALSNHAAARRLIWPLRPIVFLDEPDGEIDAWTSEQLAAIERQARAQTGMVGSAPADVFWTAWALVAQKLGCRVTALMLCRREDFSRGTASNPASLLLRRETQKQKRDQLLALPPRAAAAVERLLACHGLPRIFGCWPYDPPLPQNGRRKWKVLAKHFEERLVKPAGLSLRKGVKTRQFRRTAATIVEENGGNAQELLGHSSPKTTECYKDRKRRKACRQSFFIPDADPQKVLF